MDLKATTQAPVGRVSGGGHGFCWEAGGSFADRCLDAAKRDRQNPRVRTNFALGNPRQNNSHLAEEVGPSPKRL